VKKFTKLSDLANYAKGLSQEVEKSENHDTDLSFSNHSKENVQISDPFTLLLNEMKSIKLVMIFEDYINLIVDL